jgi:exodeoxyribonuclease-3
VINVYVVNGQSLDSDKYAYKLRWLQALHAWLQDELSRHEKLVVMGDFNIAPDDRDVYDPIAWGADVLCSPAERKALRDILDLGLRDSFRLIEQGGGHYSWWDYRQGAFRRNLGLRIDLMLISAALDERLEAVGIDREPRRWDSPSDHAPVWAAFAE